MARNITNLQRLLDKLTSLKLSNFYEYSVWLIVDGKHASICSDNLKELSEHACNTIGCAGGYCEFFFYDEIYPYFDLDSSFSGCEAIEQFLGLTCTEGNFLFFNHIEGKGIDSAIKRLQWLIDGKSIDCYPFENEVIVNESQFEHRNG